MEHTQKTEMFQASSINNDFVAVPVMVGAKGQELKGDKLTKLVKTINRILFQEHATLKATFRMIPRTEHVKDA